MPLRPPGLRTLACSNALGRGSIQDMTTSQMLVCADPQTGEFVLVESRNWTNTWHTEHARYRSAAAAAAAANEFYEQRLADGYRISGLAEMWHAQPFDEPVSRFDATQIEAAMAQLPRVPCNPTPSRGLLYGPRRTELFCPVATLLAPTVCP